MNIRQLRKTVADKGPLEFERLHCFLFLSIFFWNTLNNLSFQRITFCLVQPWCLLRVCACSFCSLLSSWRCHNLTHYLFSLSLPVTSKQRHPALSSGTQAQLIFVTHSHTHPGLLLGVPDLLLSRTRKWYMSSYLGGHSWLSCQLLSVI